MDGTKLNNPLDSLGRAEDATRELFKEFGRAANQHTAENVIGAAANILINALRQTHETRHAAEVSFDALFGRMKSLLVDNYDSLGRKRGVFPFNQVIELGLLRSKNRNGDDHG